MSVKVYKTKDGRVALSSPYHPSLPAKAKALGGKWYADPGIWAFDARDEERVRDLAREVYGTDGEEVPTVTVRYRLSGDDYYRRSLFKFGRELATRSYRDSDVRLGEGVIVVEGKFDSSGGSRRNPRLSGDKVILEVRDVPAGLVEEDERTCIVTAASWRRETLETRIAELEAELETARAELVALQEGV